MQLSDSCICGFGKHPAQRASEDDKDWLAAFLYRGEPWIEQANCKDKDPNIFFPERGQTTLEAKVVCLMCPVRKECLDYAKRTGSIEWGVWGAEIKNKKKKDSDET